MNAGSQTNFAWELADEDNPVAFFLPTNEEISVQFLRQNSMLTAKKVERATILDSLKGKIYGETEESIEAVRQSIRTTMVNEAKEIACNQNPRTKEFTAQASFGASLTFIAGIEGGLNFSGTWDTKELCGF